VNQLEIKTRQASDGTPVIELAGEVDISTVPALERELSEHEASDTSMVVVDLRSTTFLDSSGLRALAAAHARAAGNGRKFVLVRGPEAIGRVFAITGLDGRLDFVDDPGEVVAF
jgi:anti-sigma B factor antagonist